MGIAGPLVGWAGGGQPSISAPPSVAGDMEDAGTIKLHTVTEDS